MPIFVFKCGAESCGGVYEVLTKYDGTGKYRKVKCPVCGSKRKKQQTHTFAFNFGDPVGTNRWRSHDYRFYHNLPNVKKQRANAEAAAKGDSPYNEIDDVGTGKYFGPVE